MSGDLSWERAPDATTLLRFRRLHEKHGLTRAIFEAIEGHLAEQALLLREGMSLAAKAIVTPLSTKNRTKGNDPEMHQTKKGNESLVSFWDEGAYRCGCRLGVVHTVFFVHSKPRKRFLHANKAPQSFNTLDKTMHWLRQIVPMPMPMPVGRGVFALRQALRDRGGLSDPRKCFNNMVENRSERTNRSRTRG